jgi:ferritin-like metal-binding protein YciE
MRRHIEESKGQARRLEEILSGLGTSEPTLKDTMMSFSG